MLVVMTPLLAEKCSQRLSRAQAGRRPPDRDQTIVPRATNRARRRYQGGLPRWRRNEDRMSSRYPIGDHGGGQSVA